MMNKFVILAALFFQSYLWSFAQINYPFTKTVNQTDTVFNHILPDPYRWIENTKSDEVKDWFKTQQSFTDSMLANMNGIDDFINQLDRHNKNKRSWRWPIFKSSTTCFYYKDSENQLNQQVFYKELNDTTEHLIFDSWEIHPGKRYSLLKVKISPNEQYMLAALDLNGEEYPFIKIYDIINGQWLTDSIPHCYDYSVDWTADSKALIYAMNESDHRFNPVNIDKEVFKLHTLNASSTQDKTVMNFSMSGKVEKSIESYVPNLFINDSKELIFLQPNLGFKFDYVSAYYIPRDDLTDANPKWKQLYSKQDSVYSFKVCYDDYYFISGKGHGFKSLRKTSLTDPDFSNALTVLEEDKEWQLENFELTKSFVLVNYTKYGFLNKVVVIDKKTDEVVQTKCMDNIKSFNLNTYGEGTDECFFSQYEVNRPRKSFILDIHNDTLIDDKFWAVQNVTLINGWENIISEIIEVPSYDGTLVPLSIMRDKNTTLDGSNICFIYGYGAYGIEYKDNSYNHYSPVNSLLIQRGVILAHAYVRGGGEKGESWHIAGMKETKPNTWKDFIACAEYLIDNKYTSSSKLACTGASAGGILIGRAITDRPYLFAAAHIQSGSLNLTRSATFSNGVFNYPEYGNPNIENEFKGLVEMDPTIHIKPDIKYPAMYITTGWNDSRVAQWMPAKFAATLQSRSNSGKPVLLHTNFDGGHFGDANAESMISQLKTQTMAEFFMLWQCGHKDFQMKDDN